jgi:plasmid stabilization system protein ParE
MRSYELTPDAEADLEEIVRYTIEQWGESQAESYLGKISQCFKNIANKKTAAFLEKFPDACVVRCEHHYVFYLIREEERPVIFAVLHERIDMLIRLKDRLG